MKEIKGDWTYHYNGYFYKRTSGTDLKIGNLVIDRYTKIVEMIESEDDIKRLIGESYYVFTPVNFYMELNDAEGVLYKEEIN